MVDTGQVDFDVAVRSNARAAAHVLQFARGLVESPCHRDVLQAQRSGAGVAEDPVSLVSVKHHRIATACDDGQAVLWDRDLAAGQ